MRDQAIEAMAAAADPWEVFVANDGYNAIRVRNAAELAEAHLDALLDYLTEHADEWWEQAKIPPKGSTRERMLIEALR